MAIPFHKHVSSIEALHSSIEYDPQVFRWFLRCITHPKVKNHLLQTAENQKHYANLSKFEKYIEILCIVFLVIVISGLMTKHYFLLLLVIPVWGVIYKCSSGKRKHVAAISCAMLIAEKESNKFETKTLFQICETYGKKLDIPTLVDTITNQDAIMRKTFIYACITTCFLYPFDFWSNWMILFASLFLIQLAINTPLVFNRLK